MIALEADTDVQAMLDREYRHTATPKAVGCLGGRGDLDRGLLRHPGIRTRWETIRTLCHEPIHSLAHPFSRGDFQFAAVPSGTELIESLSRVCAEGTRVFSSSISLRQAAAANPSLRGQLTQV